MILAGNLNVAHVARIIDAQAAAHHFYSLVNSRKECPRREEFPRPIPAVDALSKMKKDVEV